MNTVRQCALGCAALLVGAGTAIGQVSHGSVLLVEVADEETGAPVVGAQIRLPSLARTGATNSLGAVLWRGLPPGPTHVEARALGYDPMSVDLQLRHGDSAEAVLLMRRVARRLDTTIVSASRWLFPERQRDFEMRRAEGIGRFLSDSAIAKGHALGLPLLLVTSFPGLRLQSRPPPSGKLTVVATRPSGNMASDGACPIELYLDGRQLTEDLESVQPNDLAGIEFYDETSAPQQFRRSRFACGVLLLWSKR